jgi:hypothetical protein
MFIHCSEQKKENKLYVYSNQYDKITKKQYLNDKIKTDSCNIPIDYNVKYFPLECFYDSIHNRSGNFKVRRFSYILFALKEPLLYNKVEPKIIFRFTWIRTFHNPIAIRIENNNNNYRLYWKKASGEGGYDSGDLVVNQEKVLTEQEWNKFIELINILKFWDQTTLGNYRGAYDGAEWILEGTTKEYYHVINMFSPSNGKFYDCCNYLITLTGMEFKEMEKY